MKYDVNVWPTNLATTVFLHTCAYIDNRLNCVDRKVIAYLHICKKQKGDNANDGVTNKNYNYNIVDVLFQTRYEMSIQQTFMQ